MFDSHCHLHDARVVDPDAQIARARVAGVNGFLLAGVDSADWAAQRKIMGPGIARAAGLHPQRVAELSDGEIDRELSLLSQSLDGVCAIGETGLDGLDENRGKLPRQERAFVAQLALAHERDLPLVLHILRAHGAALELLQRNKIPRAGGILHSCSASAEQVRDYLALGFHVSFAGTVCNPNAKKVHAAVRAVPIERLLVETDAPFQTPISHRPSQNEPAFLVAIVEALAQIRGEGADLVAAATEANARRVLRLEK